MKYRQIHIAETESTNGWLKTHRPSFGEDENVVVVADYQTAGRGCGSNTWESERGQNLLFSLLCHPNLAVGNAAGRDDAAAATPGSVVRHPVSQFVLSMANALALREVLADYAPDVEIKWPNDIYWKDRKLCGTLIETTLRGGHIKDCIIGTGINVNQQEFRSDAPNPVSLLQITGCRLDLQPLLERILSLFSKYLKMVEEGRFEELQAAYMASLYRREGYHSFRDAQGEFRAWIVTVQCDGTLVLQDTMRQLRHYQFKEVSFII